MADISSITPDQLKHVGDAVAVATGFAAFFQYVNDAAALLAAIWLLVRIATGIVEFINKVLDLRERRRREYREDEHEKLGSD